MTGRRLGGRRRLVAVSDAVRHEGGRPAIAVAMACLTFLAALLAAFQADAATSAARAERTADAWALERTGLDASTHVGGVRDANAFRQWFALLEEAEWARGGVDGAPAEDAALRAALARIDADLAEWVRGRSALLQPPYMDSATNVVDFNAFAADAAADGLRATEMTMVENEAADGHESKAAGYVTVLTIVAVALFFLGLAGTVAARARGVLVAAGLGLAGLAVGWTAFLAAGSPHRVPDQAVDAVVASTVALQRAGAGDPLYLAEATIPRYETAIRQAGLAIAIDPSYVSAHRALGEANLFYANARIFSDEGMSDETRRLVEAGIHAYERAIEVDDGDRNLWWNLGFARYLAGDAEGAAAASAEVIRRSPTEFVPYINLGLAELAAGRRDSAEAWVDRSLAVAAASTLDTTGAFFVRVDSNLERLTTIRPPAERELIAAFQRQIREARVAIATRGDVQPSADAPTIGSIAVVGLSLRPDGTFAEGQPIADGAEVERAGLSGLRLSVRGDGLAGHTISARVWANERGDAGYDRDIVAVGDELDIELVDPYGRAGFLLAPGRWLVELYVDGATRAAHSFEVVSPG